MTLRNDVDWPTAAEQYRAGWSAERIGQEHGVSRDTVLERLRRMGVPIRPPGAPTRVYWDERQRTYWREKQRQHRAAIKADADRLALYRRIQQLKRMA